MITLIFFYYPNSFNTTSYYDTSTKLQHDVMLELGTIAKRLDGVRRTIDGISKDFNSCIENLTDVNERMKFGCIQTNTQHKYISPQQAIERMGLIMYNRNIRGENSFIQAPPGFVFIETPTQPFNLPKNWCMFDSA